MTPDDVTKILRDIASGIDRSRYTKSELHRALMDVIGRLQDVDFEPDPLAGALMYFDDRYGRHPTVPAHQIKRELSEVLDPDVVKRVLEIKIPNQ